MEYTLIVLCYQRVLYCLQIMDNRANEKIWQLSANPDARPRPLLDSNDVRKPREQVLPLGQKVDQ